MESNNGCKAKIIITIGSLSIAAGELTEQPGQYKVWLQDINEDAPVWERSFDRLSHATGFLCDKAFPRNAEQNG